MDENLIRQKSSLIKDEPAQSSTMNYRYQCTWPLVWWFWKYSFWNWNRVEDWNNKNNFNYSHKTAEYVRDHPFYSPHQWIFRNTVNDFYQPILDRYRLIPIFSLVVIKQNVLQMKGIDCLFMIIVSYSNNNLLLSARVSVILWFRYNWKIIKLNVIFLGP